MVVYNSDIEQRLKNCTEKLHALFQAYPLMSQTIQAVEQYYNLSYRKAVRAETMEQIASSYELLVDHLMQIKNATLSPEAALKQSRAELNPRKRNALIHDVSKAVESLFWAATATTLFAAVFGVVLPVVIVQPLLGVAVGITIIGAMLNAAYKSLACLAEFKSSHRHSLEYKNEASLISFFSKAPQHVAHVNIEDESSISLKQDGREPAYCC